VGSASPRHVSVVSITGLEIWLLRSRTPLRYQQRFFQLRQAVVLLDVTEPIAHQAALVLRGLRSLNRTIGLADALIAATALEQGLTLISHASQVFAGIPGLTVVDWPIP
jgi:predicted nucleic acid-binding protein